jgi:hypothetical protein
VDLLQIQLYILELEANAKNYRKTSACVGRKEAGRTIFEHRRMRTNSKLKLTSTLSNFNMMKGEQSQLF